MLNVKPWAKRMHLLLGQKRKLFYRAKRQKEEVVKGVYRLEINEE